jgi:single-strand DNA-binding protein
MNKVILIGRLGRDPEVKYTGGGQAVASFSIATDESYKDRNGEKQKRTEWHRIVAWGKTAENVGKILRRGAQVCIEGKIQSREWQDKEGQKRTAFEIFASSFIALDGKPNGTGEAARPSSSTAGRSSRRSTPSSSSSHSRVSAHQQSSDPDAPGYVATDDDIPF